jgi:hypothetical protein
MPRQTPISNRHIERLTVLGLPQPFSRISFGIPPANQSRFLSICTTWHDPGAARNYRLQGQLSYGTTVPNALRALAKDGINCFGPNFWRRLSSGRRADNKVAGWRFLHFSNDLRNPANHKVLYLEYSCDGEYTTVHAYVRNNEAIWQKLPHKPFDQLSRFEVSAMRAICSKPFARNLDILAHVNAIAEGLEDVRDWQITSPAVDKSVGRADLVVIEEAHTAAELERIKQEFNERIRGERNVPQEPLGKTFDELLKEGANFKKDDKG